MQNFSEKYNALENEMKMYIILKIEKLKILQL